MPDMVQAFFIDSYNLIGMYYYCYGPTSQRCEVRLLKVTQLVISGVESDTVSLATELRSLTVTRQLE